MGLAFGHSAPPLRRRGLIGVARRLGAAAVTLAVPLVSYLVLAPKLPGAQVGAGLSSVMEDFVTGWQLFRGAPRREYLHRLLAASRKQRGHEIDPTFLLRSNHAAGDSRISGVPRRTTIGR